MVNTYDLTLNNELGKVIQLTSIKMTSIKDLTFTTLDIGALNV